MGYRWVIDAKILGDVCHGDNSAREFLEIFKEDAHLRHKHTVAYNTKIMNEYDPLRFKEFCKNSKESPHASTFLKEWLIGLAHKFGKPNKGVQNNPMCIKRLIDEDKFTKEDAVYVRTSLNTEDKLLVADIVGERHFWNASTCIQDDLEINLFNADEALSKIKKTRTTVR